MRARLAAIERDLDGGRYKPGPWGRLIESLRNQPDSVRATLAADVSRVSRKLHLRDGKRTIAVRTGIALEIAAIAVGGVLLAVGLGEGSTLAAIAAVAIWVIAFQPPVKIVTGRTLGIGYDYVYLLGVEPRFKMDFGSYVAAARWKRIVLHASGMAGSPLAAIVVALIADGELPIASAVCWAVLWIVLAMNLVPMGAGLLGVRRLGPLRAGDSSGGSVGIELREAITGSRAGAAS